MKNARRTWWRGMKIWRILSKWNFNLKFRKMMNAWAITKWWTLNAVVKLLYWESLTMCDFGWVCYFPCRFNWPFLPCLFQRISLEFQSWLRLWRILATWDSHIPRKRNRHVHLHLLRSRCLRILRLKSKQRVHDHLCPWWWKKLPCRS